MQPDFIIEKESTNVSTTQYRHLNIWFAVNSNLISQSCARGSIKYEETDNKMLLESKTVLHVVLARHSRPNLYLSINVTVVLMTIF